MAYEKFDILYNKELDKEFIIVNDDPKVLMDTWDNMFLYYEVQKGGLLKRKPQQFHELQVKYIKEGSPYLQYNIANFLSFKGKDKK